MRFKLPSLGGLARTSILVMFWQGVRMACLAVWIFVGARVLGAENYGLFSGTVGTATALAGLAGLGGGMLMYQYTAADRSRFARYWKQSLLLCALTAIPLSVVFCLLSRGLLPWPALYLIAVSEIVVYPFVTNAAFALSANDRMGWSAALPALNALLRLAAICIFSALPASADLTAYLALHLAASACSALLALLAVRCLLKPGPAKARISRSDLMHGSGHAAGWSSSVGVTTLDKSFVLHAGGSAIAGQYSAAYRIAAVFAMPLDAMIMSAMPRLFRAQRDNTQHRRLVASMILAALGYGIAASAVLGYGAHMLPHLLGSDFTAAIPGLQWMGLFVVGYSVRQIGCHTLLGRGWKLRKFLVEALGLLLMAALSALWIPAYGLQGAVWMIITAEAVMACIAWLVVSFSPAPAIASAQH